jgi:hypothetical protein
LARGRKLDDLAATLARGRTRRTRDKVEEAIRAITKDTWVRRVVTWDLAGEVPAELRLTWTVDPAARQQLEDELFGKHVLITDHDDWTVTEVVAGYRSQSEADTSPSGGTSCAYAASIATSCPPDRVGRNPC